MRRKRGFERLGRLGARGLGLPARRARELGLIIRSLNDVAAFCPPLIIDEGQIDEMMERVSQALDATFAWVSKGE